MSVSGHHLVMWKRNIKRDKREIILKILYIAN